MSTGGLVEAKTELEVLLDSVLWPDEDYSVVTCSTHAHNYTQHSCSRRSCVHARPLQSGVALPRCKESGMAFAVPAIPSPQPLTVRMPRSAI